MEESNEIKKLYTFLQATVYFILTLDFLVFTSFGKLITNKLVITVLERISRMAIYDNVFYSKLSVLAVMILVSIGTQAKKELEFNAKNSIGYPILFGFTLFFGVGFIFIFETKTNILWIDSIYILLSIIGALLMHVALDNISKMIKTNLGKDRFNRENESFSQSIKKVENEYSINLPMQFYYKKKWNKGWLNLTNPFRGSLVIGTPGSGKSFSVIEPAIRQFSSKGFCMMVYDFKFPALTNVTYYNFLLAKQQGKIPKNMKFRVINFDEVEYSHRINPLSKEYIKSLASASEIAEALVHSMKKSNSSGSGADQFFTRSAINFLAATIFFFSRHEDGKYSTLPHILSFLNQDYETIFNVLYTNDQIESLLSPFKTAFKNQAFDQLEGQIGTLKTQLSPLATHETFWVLGNQNDFNLKITDRDDPSYLILANNPETQNINSTSLALILNRLTRLINTKGNFPCALIVDELPTLYFHQLENLIATARSNKVAILLALQELTQFRLQYGKETSESIVSIIGNIISGSVRDSHTLDWLQKVFGKIKQIKEGVSIDRNKTSISLNESMDYLIPASKIADLGEGELVAQLTSDRSSDIEIPSKYNCRITLDMKEIKYENSNYPQLPIVYNFNGNKEEALRLNFKKINNDVIMMISSILES